METVQADRRAMGTASLEDPGAAGCARDLAAIVRQALRLQACIGTAGAVEYLKAYDLRAQVIGRVLSGGMVRGEDLGPRIATPLAAS